ncbi:MAG: hypothetical protein AB3X44_15470 [Leptothrix sp. (in: b-proteobacteria)]
MLPFIVEDDLVEPLPASMVIRIICDRAVELDTLDALTNILKEWLGANVAIADQLGAEAPEGEAVQVGEQSVEFQIFGAQGHPDNILEGMLQGLAQICNTRQKIVLVEMD